MTPELRKLCHNILEPIRNSTTLESFVLRAYWKGRLHLRRHRSPGGTVYSTHTLNQARVWLDWTIDKLKQRANSFKTWDIGRANCIQNEIEGLTAVLVLHDTLFQGEMAAREKRLHERLEVSDAKTLVWLDGRRKRCEAWKEARAKGLVLKSSENRA